MSCVPGLSTVEVMRVARASFIQFSSRRYTDDCMPAHVLGSAPLGLSDQETKDVELAHLLLAFAEKVAKQQYGCARKLQNLCHFLSSSCGNSVQRVVYYFTKALQEKTDRETGRNASEGSESRDVLAMHFQEATASSTPALMACFLEVPFYQVTEFAGIQAIVETVASAKKIHFIDLAIRTGGHCIVLMQALATRYECPIELLKVTAVGVTSREKIEDTGRRLAQFAEALKLPFSFKVAMVKDIKDINEDTFELEDGEAAAVYCPLLLCSTMRQPNCSESLIKVLRNLNPHLMVITEIEANHNSPTFTNRFNEALLYYSAYFECLDVCMDRGSAYRMELEETYLSLEIKNIIASEGKERIIRRMKIDAWRTLFAECGMVEAELSLSSLYQADLVAKQFACGSCCTLDTNGKGLIVGWKGTPILSLSVWKFPTVNAKTAKYLM
ncbi:DELLA protein GAI1 [Prunus yedoensis var. nudiflora]|uniref:DELLA protein GAI1 n=1 Tax=Prunus yedoensis var. nudiflora TaxID=2094558 RepID=A0A314V2K9_PRUYE|nr:DELLA protein GAI1 [Prunus yedoensis var. nudiflora]